MQESYNICQQKFAVAKYEEGGGRQPVSGWSRSSELLRSIYVEEPLGSTSAWTWTTSDGNTEHLDQSTVPGQAPGTRVCGIKRNEGTTARVVDNAV